MSEELYDPFAESNMATGGLWDGKTVTIISAVTRVDWLQRNVGEGRKEAVIDKNTGQPAYRNVLAITGIADGEEKEREETYSAGALIPTEDGKSFRRSDGQPVKFHPKSELGKFGKAIRDGGFDTTKLNNNGVADFSALKGSRFVFAGVQQVDEKGNPKVNKKDGKEYPVLKFYPRKFESYRGVAANGNGTDHAAADAKIVAALSGGSLSQADLVRALGDHAVVQYMLRTSGGAGWSKSGSTYSVA